ncbi:hypothetical protein ABVT39_000586 [Epinephelus coioides]
MFALDHTHYSRWLSVHVRDMMVLSDKHPAILEEFCAGKFVVHKTSHKFSAIAIDHCHEQNNALIKGSGGAAGLTENPGALRRWIVAGPEIARMTTDFENKSSPQGENRHHEQQPAVQEAFMKHVRSLTAVIEEMGNPFLEESQDFLVLDSKDIMSSAVADTVRKVESLGAQQYKTFVEERLEQQTNPLTDTLPKNKMPLFSHSPVKTQSKHKIQLESLKRDCNLFSRLYVSCQTRDGNLDQFFSHKNQEAPPSLSQGGKIGLGTKADLLHCMITDDTDSKRAPVVDAVFLDGAAVVQMLNPGTAKTFQDYADSFFVPYAKSQLEKTRRLDIIWDVYIPDSLKGTTRQKRAKGIRSDAVQKGCKKVTIRTVDTAVVVLVVAMFRKIKPEEMWIALGSGTSLRYIGVHEVPKKLDPSTCAALPLFHALTGCDTVSAFAGRGKKKA